MVSGHTFAGDVGTSATNAHVTHVPVDGAASDSHRITVSDTELLLSAHYSRAGADLVLMGADGKKLVLSGYFDQAKQADLVAPGGAVLTAEVVAKLTVSQMPGHYAQVGAPAGGVVIGHVERLGGHATVQHANGTVEELKVGDNVLQGDVVETSAGSQLGMNFADGTAFNLGAGARMVLSELVYDASSSSNSAVFSLVKGSISFVAGQVAKTGDMRVETPVATMGIRGTSVNTNISTDVNGNAVSVTYSLMADPDGHVGSFNILDRATGAIIGTITTTDTTFVVTPNGNLGVIAAQIDKTPDQVAQELAVAQALFPIFLANPINFNSPNVTPQNSPTKSGSFGSSDTFGGSQQNLTDPAPHTNDPGPHTDNTTPTPPSNSNPVIHTAPDQTVVVAIHKNSAPSIFADVAPPHLVEATTTNPGVSNSLAHLFLQDIDGAATVSYNTSALLAAGWILAAGVYVKSDQYGMATLNTLANTLTYQLDNVKADPLGSGDHPVESFVIPVIDNEGATAFTTVGFTIDGKNDTLKLAGGPIEFVSVAENTAGTFATIHTQDPHNSGLTYSIVPGSVTSGSVVPSNIMPGSIESGSFSFDASKFTIDPLTGKLSFITPPDYEHPTDLLHLNLYIVQVKVTDGTLTDTQTLVVHVTDVNDTAIAGNDTAITNNIQDSNYLIPKWALLANDRGPDGSHLDVAGVSSLSGFTSVDLTSSPGNVAVHDDSQVGGSFDYQLSAGSLTDTAHVTVTQSANTMNGGSGNEIFIGDSNGTTINANGGNDILIGNGGNDTLNGGSGNDIYGFGLSDGHDTVNDTSGNDTIRIDTGDAALSSLNFAETAGGDLVINANDLQITVNNHFSGANNIESLTFVGGSYKGYDLGGTYSLSNDGGTNRTAGSGNTILSGDSAANSLTGGAGNDLLFGNDGNDRLKSGTGNDLLVGGAGNDTFVFGPHFGKDVIADFTVGVDAVQFDASVFANFTALMGAVTTDAHGNAVVTDAALDTITFQNVTKAQLAAHPDDFHFISATV